jgi:aspartate racemase
VGVTGELYLGGDGLAAGYLGQPDLTAQRFVPNPFSDDPSARLFKTGDQVRYLPDGVLVFLGRADHQVKVRGVRIELGEIESVLLSHPAIRAAHVIVRADEPNQEQLVAYVVLHPGHSASVDFRAFLAQTLPDYMLPSALVPLAEMPLTPNGKTDRNALPAPANVRQGPGDTFVAPRDDLERDLCCVWAEVLGRDPVGVNDNYFDLGGHSPDGRSPSPAWTRAAGRHLVSGADGGQNGGTDAGIAGRCGQRLQPGGRSGGW